MKVDKGDNTDKKVPVAMKVKLLRKMRCGRGLFLTYLSPRCTLGEFFKTAISLAVIRSTQNDVIEIYFVYVILRNKFIYLPKCHTAFTAIVPGSRLKFVTNRTLTAI